MKDVCGIYSITNTINDKIYIGQSIHCYKRFTEHKYNLNRCGAIYLAFKKYGIEKFQLNIVKECELDELNNLEQYYIIFFNTLSPNGYNLNTGGGVNTVVCEETRRKMSESQSGEKNPMYGKKMSDETKEKIRQANIGRVLSDESKNKIGKANSGKKHTEETKEKNRQGHLGTKLSNEIVNERLYSHPNKIRKLLYKRRFDGYFIIENSRIRFHYNNGSNSFNFSTHGYVNAIKKAFDLKFSKINYFNQIKEFHSNYIKIKEQIKNYKNTSGYISLSLGRIAFIYSQNGKQYTKTFSINKYGYVHSMKNCLDLMFTKNDYFIKRIKILNQKNYFIS
jgi:group I intron endonuclease